MLETGSPVLGGSGAEPGLPVVPPMSSISAQYAGGNVRFGILGSTVIYDPSGSENHLAGKASQTAAVLITSIGQVVPIDRLADLVWEGAPPSSAKTMLRGHIKNIRSVLGRSGKRYLVSAYGGYRLERGAGCVDSELFETLHGEARKQHSASDFVGAEEAVTRALWLWRGTEAFAGVRNIIALEGAAVRLEELRLQCQQLLIECHLGLGHAERALPVLRTLTVQHPTSERLWLLLMIAQAAMGRRPDAGSTYRRARRVYLEEHGIQPSAQLDEMHRRILCDEDVPDLVRAVLQESHP